MPPAWQCLPSLSTAYLPSSGYRPSLTAGLIRRRRSGWEQTDRWCGHRQLPDRSAPARNGFALVIAASTRTAESLLSSPGRRRGRRPGRCHGGSGDRHLHDSRRPAVYSQLKGLLTGRRPAVFLISTARYRYRPSARSGNARRRRSRSVASAGRRSVEAISGPGRRSQPGQSRRAVAGQRPRLQVVAPDGSFIAKNNRRHCSYQTRMAEAAAQWRRTPAKSPGSN